MSVFDDFKSLGRLSEEVTILGKKIKWHTLDGKEALEAWVATSVFDPYARIKAIKRQKLARAIEELNGIPVLVLAQKMNEGKPEQKTSVEVMNEEISTWQDSVIDIFYDEYGKLEIKSIGEIEKLKKS